MISKYKYFDDKSKSYLFFIPNFLVGGAERFLIQVANSMIADGFSVCIVVSQKKGELLSLVDSRISILDLNVKKVSLSAFKLFKIINKIDRPHLVTTMYHCNLVGCLLKICKRNLTLTIRESTALDFYFNYSGLLKTKLLFFLFNFFYRYADEIIFPSIKMKERFLEYINLGKDIRIRILQNTVNSSELDISAKEKIDDNIWRRTCEFVIINVGRLDENKNQQLIIKAMALLKDVNVEFIHVGDGEKLEYLKKMSYDLAVENRVHFLGYQQNPFKFLKASDIFILSSLVEGYPNVLVQARYFGLEIISLDCPTGPSEILSDYNKGHLVNIDSENLEEIIAKRVRAICLN